jgi:hypothetical protein
MISIPEELLEQIERGNVLLFIGERIARDAEGQAVVDRLAVQLATRCDLKNPEVCTFPEAAQAYEDAMGRQALVQFIRDQMGGLGNEPQRVHRLIAGLTDCKVLAITCIDRRLERAFEEAGRPFDVIIGNIDVAFEDERKAQVYKLRGSVEWVESLVLTEDDYETFFEDQASISVVLQGYLARKTILFVGYDLADPHFKRLYCKVTAPLDAFARRAYAFGEVPARRVARWCRRHNIEVVETRATAFLEALTEQLANRARPELVVPQKLVKPTALSVPERPYKLLDYYEARDAAIFFGRERETQTLMSLIHAHRLVLLYGASGTGKTSLLLAGALPYLEQAEPPYKTLYVRVLEDPAQVIRRAIQRWLPEVKLPQEGGLVDFLNVATKALECTLVIFLDQFEEFFIRWGPQFRQAFISEIGELYEARDVPVKIVFSLREDWLALMNEVETRIPEVYRTKMQLLPLSHDQVRQAITSPVTPLGIHYDSTLIERLFEDLVDEQWDEPLRSKHTTVMPAHLQLVCDALYERAQAEDRQSITMADYEAVGQAQGILARYIESALQEYPGEERGVAKNVLMTLVTSQATKAWTDLERIAFEVGAEMVVVERVLARLIRQRLVRRLDEGQTYELVHDILAATIAQWISGEDRQLKQARELLRRELADWRQEPSLLLSQGKFQRINAVRDGLQLTDEETAFLLRAAVWYDIDVSHWLEQVPSPTVQVDILLELLESKADQARLTAARFLAGFPRDDVAAALARRALEDSEPGVRDLSAISLGQMGGKTGLNLLIDAASARADPQRARALRALALNQDVAPDRPGEMAGPLRRRVYYELAKIRFWRNWPKIRKVTVAGAIGGAVGFGLGLIPLIAWQLANVYGDRWRPIDLVFIALVLAVLGLPAGAGMAFGISVGEALFSKRTRMGRVLGGTFLGGLSFMLVLAPLAIVDATEFLEGVLTIAGGGLFGMMIGLGLTLPAMIRPRRAVVLGGGAVGAALGLIVFGALGFDPFQVTSQPAVPIPVLLISGGLLGLILAFSITWAETRWSPAVKGDAMDEAGR